MGAFKKGKWESADEREEHARQAGIREQMLRGMTQQVHGKEALQWRSFRPGTMSPASASHLLLVQGPLSSYLPETCL